MMVNRIFEEVLGAYGVPGDWIAAHWEAIRKKYAGSSRHYHNLEHLEHMLGVLLPVKDQIKDWDAIVIALVYHDAVYNVLRKNNEEKSAEWM